MNKRVLARLEFLEAADADGQGAFLFVEERSGVYHDDHTNRNYTEDQLVALHHSRPDLIVFARSSDSAASPPHPAGNPRGRTLDDLRRRNEITAKCNAGEVLSADDQAFLDDYEAADRQDAAAYEAWEAESAPLFDEQVARLERLNAIRRSRQQKR